MIIGGRIKELRKKLKLTQEELADKIQISRSALANYECGSREPKGDILVRFAHILNTSIDYILGNSDSPYTEQLREESKQAQYRAVLSDKDLPPEAVKEIEDFVRYIEYKYKK